MRTPEIGEHVVYVDPYQVRRDGLVTNVFPPWGDHPASSINLVFISGDEARTDSCGRQSQHATSTPHRSHQMAPGNYWVFPDEKE